MYVTMSYTEYVIRILVLAAPRQKYVTNTNIPIQHVAGMGL